MSYLITHFIVFLTCSLILGILFNITYKVKHKFKHPIINLIITFINLVISIVCLLFVLILLVDMFYLLGHLKAFSTLQFFGFLLNMIIFAGLLSIRDVFRKKDVK